MLITAEGVIVTAPEAPGATFEVASWPDENPDIPAEYDESV